MYWSYTNIQYVKQTKRTLVDSLGRQTRVDLFQSMKNQMNL